MKTILLSFIFLLFLQDNSQVFQIIDLKNQYNYKDQINFSIKNNSKKNIIYFVSLYTYKNDWRPAVSDIENPKK